MLPSSNTSIIWQNNIIFDILYVCQLSHAKKKDARDIGGASPVNATPILLAIKSLLIEQEQRLKDKEELRVQEVMRA